jgi:hypothetical protein
VHISLAHHHCSASSQALDYGGIAFRNVVSEELRSTSRSDTLRAENVFDSDRDAVQWAATLSVSQLTVSLLGLAFRQLSSDSDERFQLGIKRSDSAQ